MKVLSVQQIIYINWRQIQGKMIWNQARKHEPSVLQLRLLVELYQSSEVGSIVALRGKLDESSDMDVDSSKLVTRCVAIVSKMRKLMDGRHRVSGWQS